MKAVLVKATVVGAVVAASLLGGASAASAATAPVTGVAAQGPILPVPVEFDGVGTGSTAATALDNAVLDARSKALAAGFDPVTDCVILGDPIVTGMVIPGQPITYRAQVVLGCTG
jgi:hypothetical protein